MGLGAKSPIWQRTRGLPGVGTLKNAGSPRETGGLRNEDLDAFRLPFDVGVTGPQIIRPNSGLVQRLFESAALAIRRLVQLFRRGFGGPVAHWPHLRSVSPSLPTGH